MEVKETATKVMCSERLCRTELRDEGKKHILVGVPVVFEQYTEMDFWSEVIDRHALDDTDLRDVKFLVNHDTDQLPLARSRNNNANSTMQLSVQEDGLHIQVSLDTEGNERARELYSAVSRGDIDGMSFMFTVDEDSWEDLDSDHPIRRITKIGRIYEVSAVTFPAYEQTSISARSLESGRASLESAKSALESARKTEALRKAVTEKAEQLANGGKN